MTNPIKPPLASASMLFFLAAAAWLSSGEPLRAQQRDPAVEVYGLTGAYYFGHNPNVLKNREWRPLMGMGVLFPWGTKWAFMLDGVTSRLEVNEGPHGPLTDHPYSEFYRVNPGIPNEDVTTQRLIAILPSIVRMWRREKFSIYVGGGFGVEHQRQRIRYRPVDVRENAAGGRTLVRADGFVESRDAVSTTPLILRAGGLVNLAPRVVLRTGYSYLLGYTDSPASQSLEAGIGFRF